MYEVVAHRIPKDCNFQETINDLVGNIRAGKDVEESMDILYRMTYLIVLPELNKYPYIGTPDELISDMSMAFMKTIKGYDPDNPNASFIQYYKRAIFTEIINNYYGKFSHDAKKREEYRYFMNGVKSLSEEVYKDGIEAGTWEDLIEDDNNIFEETIDRIGLEDAINKALDEIFDNPKTKARGEEIFRCYIELCMADEYVTYDKVAEKVGGCKANVSNIVHRYGPKLYEILKREGIM